MTKQNPSQNLPWEEWVKPFRIVVSQNPVKNGLSSVACLPVRQGVPRYTSLVCSVFSSDFAKLWIAIGFWMSSMRIKTKLIILRAIADFLLITAAFLLPWWVVLLCAAALFFVFERFFELFLVAFLMDLLFAVPLPRFGRFEFVLSFGSVFLYLILNAIKKKMRI